jgi:uncharacterized RmlC-like cupin family protein
MTMATLEQLMLAVLSVDAEAYNDYRHNGTTLEHAVYSQGGRANGWYATQVEAWGAYAAELKAHAEEVDRIGDLAIETLTAVLPVVE